MARSNCTICHGTGWITKLDPSDEWGEGLIKTECGACKSIPVIANEEVEEPDLPVVILDESPTLVPWSGTSIAQHTRDKMVNDCFARITENPTKNWCINIQGEALVIALRDGQGKVTILDATLRRRTE